MAEQSTCVRGEPAEPEPAHSSSADTKPKSIKKPTGWNFFFQSVAVSLFCISQNIPAFLARIKRLFEQSHMLLFPRFLYHSTARSVMGFNVARIFHLNYTEIAERWESQISTSF